RRLRRAGPPVGPGGVLADHPRDGGSRRAPRGRIGAHLFRGRGESRHLDAPAVLFSARRGSAALPARPLLSEFLHRAPRRALLFPGREPGGSRSVQGASVQSADPRLPGARDPGDAGHPAPLPLSRRGGSVQPPARGAASLVPARLARLPAVVSLAGATLGARPSAGGDPGRLRPPPLPGSDSRARGVAAALGPDSRRRRAGDLARLHLHGIPDGEAAMIAAFLLAAALATP